MGHLRLIQGGAGAGPSDDRQGPTVEEAVAHLSRRLEDLPPSSPLAELFRYAIGLAADIPGDPR